MTRHDIEERARPKRIVPGVTEINFPLVMPCGSTAEEIGAISDQYNEGRRDGRDMLTAEILSATSDLLTDLVDSGLSEASDRLKRLRVAYVVGLLVTVRDRYESSQGS